MKTCWLNARRSRAPWTNRACPLYIDGIGMAPNGLARDFALTVESNQDTYENLVNTGKVRKHHADQHRRYSEGTICDVSVEYKILYL